MFWLLPLLLALLPSPDIIEEHVDLIEVNHFHDENGKLVFDQLIFYDWSPLEGHYHVRAWRLLKANEQLPARDYRTGEFSSVWHDGDVLRRIVAQATKETWTQHDPELTEREFLAKEKRRDLVKLTSKAPPTSAGPITLRVGPTIPFAPAVPPPPGPNIPAWP